MEYDKKLPQDYMAVGEMAKKMGVTVRTLQYYDQQGLLSPSAESEGGRRLYTDRDMILLHQILSLKHLGFSLDAIKNHLTALETPADVAAALTEQASVLRRKIETLSESLQAIEALKTEVLQMQSVDFKKYADIIVNLQMKNESYWLIKYFDDKTLDHIRNHFDKDSGFRMIATFTRLNDRAIELQAEGIPPESDKGRALAEEFWNMIQEFTAGDESLLENLMEIGSFDGLDDEWKARQTSANAYLGPALDAYLTELGINPFEEDRE